jgi:SAM-dependent methyltransferase
MEYIVCNLCQSDDLIYLYEIPDHKYNPKEIFKVVECKNCGLGFVNPRPAFEEMKKYYPSDFYQNLSGAEIKDLSRLKSQANYIDENIKLNNNIKILDVGCANGTFLNSLNSNKYILHGVDPYSPIQDSRKIKIFKTSLLELPLNTPYFDVITAWAVMEHVHNPMEYFRKIGDILKKDGVFIFFVPNFKSLAVKNLYLEDVPRHLYFYTPDNIRRFASEVGLKIEVEDYKNKYFIYNPNRWLWFLVYRIFGRKLNWPVNTSYSQYILNSRERKSIKSLLKFLILHPISFVDSLFAPLIGKIERHTGRYAAVIYVARKI